MNGWSATKLSGQPIIIDGLDDCLIIQAVWRKKKSTICRGGQIAHLLLFYQLRLKDSRSNCNKRCFYCILFVRYSLMYPFLPFITNHNWLKSTEGISVQKQSLGMHAETYFNTRCELIPPLWLDRSQCP